VAYTYTNNPGSSTRDAVRLLIFDTDTTGGKAKLSDEEIQFYINRNSHVSLAAAEAAEAVAAKYAPAGTSKQVGDLKIEGQGVTYRELARSLRGQAARRAGSGVYAGGTSIADKKAQEDDTDRIQPEVKVGQDDHPGTDTDRGIVEW
jgi:hypothetical protein